MAAAAKVEYLHKEIGRSISTIFGTRNSGVEYYLQIISMPGVHGTRTACDKNEYEFDENVFF